MNENRSCQSYSFGFFDKDSVVAIKKNPAQDEGAISLV